MPNLLSLIAYCVCPELRPLPSTGITRLHRYYEPLRHPIAPRPSLTGVRLLDPSNTPWGFPCCVRFPLCTCCRHYPGAATGFQSAQSPNRVSLPRSEFPVGLRIVLFEACSAFTRVAACTLAPSPYIVTSISRRLQPFRYLHSCSGSFRLEQFAGWDSHPLENAAFPRRTSEADLHERQQRVVTRLIAVGDLNVRSCRFLELTPLNLKSLPSMPCSLKQRLECRITTKSFE